jgi:ABC-2 type transport system ATP-binding protein
VSRYSLEVQIRLTYGGEVTDTAAISISHLVKRYGSLTAVDDVSLTVAPGVIFGLVGPNGSGKSTTIRVLLGYLSPTSGAAQILGGDARQSVIRSRVGYLPGDLRLPPSLTPRRILAFTQAALSRAGTTVASDEIAQLAHRLDLDLDRRFGQLSKGNRQKVGIARALLGSPKVLVLDEPTGGLDPLVQETVLAIVRERADDGSAVLFSSHVLSEVESIANRVAILARGRVVAEDDVTTLVAQAPQRLHITLANAPEAHVLAGITNVSDVLITGTAVEVTVHGSAQEVFHRLAPSGVERVRSAGNELDEVFARSVHQTVMREGDAHQGDTP